MVIESFLSSSERSLSDIISAKPSIPFSGVLTSCEILLRKSVFSLSLVSAFSLAILSASEAFLRSVISLILPIIFSGFPSELNISFADNEHGVTKPSRFFSVTSKSETEPVSFNCLIMLSRSPASE